MNTSHTPAQLVDVTPETAREWLTHNTHNRTVRWRAVTAYAADMQSGDWQWNGEAIKFAADGTLLDGQNRLYAVIEADVTVQMLTVSGLPRATQESMDGGTKRKFSDVLQLRGEVNYIPLSSVVRRVTLWEMGARKWGNNRAPSNAQLLQTLDKYPWLRDVASSAGRVASTCALPATVIGLGMWLFVQIDEEDSEFFFERLSDGQGLIKGDPIYELRRRAEGSKTIRGERSTTFLTAILIKSWNAYRAGTSVSLLMYRPGGANPELFPEPR